MTFTLPAATETSFEQCPIGLYVFKLKSMERGIEGNPQYGGGERVKWIFEIERVIDANENDPSADNPDPKPIEAWVGEEFWAFTSLNMGKKATMRAWSEALLGRSIADGEALNAGELIGKRAKATVGRNENERQKIMSLVQIKGRAAPKPAPAPVEEDADDDELF